MKASHIKIDNNTIDYITFGNGKKPFVIIPGLSLVSVMNSADAVAQAYEQFADDYTVYLFDRARNITDGYAIENMADDTAEAMKKLGIADAYIFGASQGGMIAQYIAIKHPSLVKRLVLGSSASRLSDRAKDNLNTWVTLAREQKLEMLNHSINTLVYSKEFLAGFDAEFLAQLEKVGTTEDMQKFSKVASACFSFDVYNELSKIQCPVLVIGAKNDAVLGVVASNEIAEKLGCELYIYDGAHAVYDEAPDYKDRLQAFFEK